MKSILALAMTLMSFASMANEINCVAKNTKVSIDLKLTETAFFPLRDSKYTYGQKVIPLDDISFSISGNQEKKTKTLTYKFQTLKKHALAPKRTHLAFSIVQKDEDSEPTRFALKEGYEAILIKDEGAGEVFVDSFICQDQ